MGARAVSLRSGEEAVVVEEEAESGEEAALDARFERALRRDGEVPGGGCGISRG